MTAVLHQGLALEATPFGRRGTAIVTGRLNEEVVVFQKVDLANPKSRCQFIESLATKMTSDLDESWVEDELIRFGAQMADDSSEDDFGPSEPDTQTLLMRMPQHVRDEASALLESANLIEQIIDDVVCTSPVILALLKARSCCGKPPRSRPHYSQSQPGRSGRRPVTPLKMTCARFGELISTIVAKQQTC